MRIWYQLVSAEKERSHFLEAVQALCSRAAQPGTTVEVRGTSEGALGDQMRLFYNYDVREFIDNGLRVRKSGGYDAFVVANSLDGGIVELREILDIPVLSFMEVACSVGCMMGEKVGILAPYRRMTPLFREIERRYLLPERRASVDWILAEAVPGFKNAFSDPGAGDEAVEKTFAAARRTIEQGAEVVIPAGPATALLAQRGIFDIDGVPLLDCYTLLVKAAEMMVSMRRLTGSHVSRRLMYGTFPDADMQRIAKARGLDLS